MSLIIQFARFTSLLTATPVEMSDPSWISYKKGEILFTDGLLRATGPSELQQRTKFLAVLILPYNEILLLSSRFKILLAASVVRTLISPIIRLNLTNLTHHNQMSMPVSFLCS